ncbi:unnamed protein product [Phytophthora fragariaefolia]|uniref:Unnamed protein product n=1 Tax=Phytophthora fragariaefolia TaxID=1490495 RepID=A0A9W6XL08_9STRA|nr:unnamed protein product [Phytophthora fragariaefolia]
MAELASCCQASRGLPTAASLFPTTSQGIEWQGKLNSVDKDTAVGKVLPGWTNEDDEDNQDDDNPHEGDEDVHDSESSAPCCEGKLGDGELHQLRIDHTAMMERLAQMEAQHAKQIDVLEVKLQQAIANHRDAEKKLELQLKTVLDEQQAAVENARKVRSILARVSTWVSQVQRSVHAVRPSRHVAKPVNSDHELVMTPRHDSPYKLWATDVKPTTNASESLTASHKLTLQPLQWSASDSYSVRIDDTSETCQTALPPPAPGRHRSKSLPGIGFSYVGYNIASPQSSQPSEIVLKPGPEIILDGLPSVSNKPRSDTPVPKRSPGNLFAYCAQVVTTSLAGVRSSPELRVKSLPAWKGDRLPSVLEELEIDEETGQCTPRASNNNQRLNISLPNLSIGLL